MVASPPVTDRSEMFRRLNDRLVIDPATTAVITIDCHRGHLDPQCATQPVPAAVAARVVRRLGALLPDLRARRIPIIHVILTNRVLAGRPEPMHNPFWRAVEEVNESLTPHAASTISGHNRVGSVQTELMPELGPAPEDILVTTKRRLSIFLGTDLDIILQALGTQTVILAGINTNTCVQCAAFESCNRNLATVVISDCVASMYGEDLHFLGLQNIARCLGWVLTGDQLLAKLGAGASPAPSVAGAPAGRAV